MKPYEATEAAYKNGYKKGYEDGKADAVKRGRWEERYAIIFDSGLYACRCSECNTTWDAKTNYCPYCGADMRGGDNG